jgi:Ni/Co efflux regulator RcnB
MAGNGTSNEIVLSSDNPAACPTALGALGAQTKELSMKNLTVIAVALTLLGSSAALAQYNGSPSYGNRGGSADQQDNQYQNRNNQNGSQQGRDQNQNDNQGANRYDSQRGEQGRNDVRDNPHWSRGDRLPTEYRNNNQYVVSDWKNNHLRKPPRGYHWVQANNQYVLAAVASGLIADIIIASNQNDQRRR